MLDKRDTYNATMSLMLLRFAAATTLSAEVVANVSGMHGNATKPGVPKFWRPVDPVLTVGLPPDQD
jgi:hypothetical protein